MNGVKQYTFTLFCCSAAAALIDFIAPQSCKKQISYITGMIMLITLISPFTELADGFDIVRKEAEYNPLQDISSNEILAEQFRFNLISVIEDKLALSGIFAEDIRIEIIMSDDEIKLGDIEVFLNSQDNERAEQVKQILENYLKVKISVREGIDNIEGK